MGTAFLYGNGGSGGTGATLTVTAPAGCTVTVSKDGKTKTKTAGADGTAVFKGLETGTWTVTITDGGQQASKNVTVTADYATSITFFAATIHITYPAGSVCTATDGITTLTAPDTSGTWACVVPNAGTWTVMENRNGWTYAAEITQDGQTVNADISKYYLVKNGVPQVTFTAKAIKAASSWASGATAVAPTISGTVGGYYKAYIKKTRDQPCGTVVTSAAIPIKNSKSLKCEGYKTSRASYGVAVCLWNTQTPTYWQDEALASKYLNTAVDVYPIDTTSLQNRNLFIGFGFLTGDTDDTVMYIKNLWLE